MNKSDLVNVIAETTGLPMDAAQHGVEGLFNAMAEAMEAGERVTLANFGSFRVVRRGRRVGRNLHTGEPVPIPPRRVVKFIASRGLTQKMGARPAEGIAA
ncbi:MAG: hypothetical protein BWK76_12765 [Desulfobulbaceae bacterium A2]|nr:MAG: hypothetical protein BWK76_12765 [Desulfobulbaceae bacterium A2]